MFGRNKKSTPYPLDVVDEIHLVPFMIPPPRAGQGESIYKKTIEQFVEMRAPSAMVKDPLERSPVTLAKGLRKHANKYNVAVKKVGDKVFLLHVPTE